MSQVIFNGETWRVRFVDSSSDLLIDRSGRRRLATTDPSTMSVYISNVLHGEILYNVVLHELGHCIMYSYNIIPELHKMVYPNKWIEAEEWCCNYLAEFSTSAIAALHDIVEGR